MFLISAGWSPPWWPPGSWRPSVSINVFFHDLVLEIFLLLIYNYFILPVPGFEFSSLASLHLLITSCGLGNSRMSVSLFLCLQLGWGPSYRDAHEKCGGGWHSDINSRWTQSLVLFLSGPWPTLRASLSCRPSHSLWTRSGLHRPTLGIRWSLVLTDLFCLQSIITASCSTYKVGKSYFFPPILGLLNGALKLDWQIMGRWGVFLKSVLSQLPSVQNNPYAKVTYFGGSLCFYLSYTNIYTSACYILLLKTFSNYYLYIEKINKPYILSLAFKFPII